MTASVKERSSHAEGPTLARNLPGLKTATDSGKSLAFHILASESGSSR